MKKFIALVLVLVMVLSLSTVAFARQLEYEMENTLLTDVYMVIARIFGIEHAGKHIDGNSALRDLVGAVVQYYDTTIEAIVNGFYKMAPINEKAPAVANGISNCVRHLANAFGYVHGIGFVFDK